MFLLLFLSLLSALLELAGVTSTVPFMALASSPQLLQTPGRLSLAYQWLGSPELQTFLVSLGLLIFGAFTLSIWLAAVSMWLGYRFSHDQQERLSRQLFEAFLGQNYAWHLSNHHMALGHSLAQARGLMDSNFRPLLGLLSRLCSVLFLIVPLLYFNPQVTLCGLLGLLTMYGGTYVWCRRALLRASLREWHLGLEMAATASEPLGGIKHVKLASSERSYALAYQSQLTEVAQLQRTKLLALELPRLTMHTLVYGSLLGLVIYLVSRYGSGTEVVARASLFALAGYRLVPGIQQIFQSLAQLESGRPALDKIYEHLQLRGQPLAPPPEPLPVVQSISLQQITFGYAEAPLFRDLDLTIRANTTVGLVGPTGFGKTTLVNLLVGLLEPQRGHLCVDGVALGPLELRRYGRAIGYVPQDIYLSDDTILNNIGLGLEPVDEAAVLRAARAARVDEFVRELPDGYATRVGERGIRLSGGQRQRVGIARALYRDPAILVFDEATSALDSATEAEVMNCIRSMAHRKTILLVAHRLTTVAHCDVIYVVGRGGILASGTYAELAASSAAFQELIGANP